MKARNKVIAGNFMNKMVSTSFNQTFIILDWSKNLYLDKYSVAAYEVMNEEHGKSAANVLGRAAVGSLFGGLGAIAGAVTAKNKGIYTVAISFTDGNKSLIEIDEKIYKAFIAAMF